MNLSSKTFNILRINDCLLLSDFVLTSNAQKLELCFGDRNSAREIALFSREWLHANRAEITAFCEKESDTTLKQLF